MGFVANILGASSLDWPTTRVLEIGSYNVNGSVRTIIEPRRPESYLGTDMRPGPGVDYVCPAEELRDHLTGSYGLVICCEVLEHAEHWRDVIATMKALTMPGGLMILTTRAPGFPLHEYPGDFWRFTCAELADVFADCGGQVLPWQRHGAVVEMDPQVPGVFVAARKPLRPEQWPEPYRMPT